MTLETLGAAPWLCMGTDGPGIDADDEEVDTKFGYPEDGRPEEEAAEVTFIVGGGCAAVMAAETISCRNVYVNKKKIN